MKKYPKLGTVGVLGILARKPEAFPETKSNIIQRTINLGKHLCSWMFSTHQLYQNEYPDIGNGSVPADDLAQKRQPSPETKFNIIGRTIKSGKYFYFHIKCLKIGIYFRI